MISAQAQSLGGKHIAAFLSLVAAIQSDGTVKAVGNNDFGQCETQDWRDVTAISASPTHVLGLRRDGIIHYCLHAEVRGAGASGG